MRNEQCLMAAEKFEWSTKHAKRQESHVSQGGNKGGETCWEIMHIAPLSLHEYL